MVDHSKQWPRWPSDQSGFQMLDVVVDKSLEDLFSLMFGGDNKFQVRPILRILPVRVSLVSMSHSTA